MSMTRHSNALKVAFFGMLLCSGAAARVVHAQTAHVHAEARGSDAQRKRGALIDTVREATGRGRRRERGLRADVRVCHR